MSEVEQEYTGQWVPAKKLLFVEKIAGVEYGFRRQWEAIYAKVLQSHLEGGKIKAWEYHPKPAFEYKGKKQGEMQTFQPSFKVTKADGGIKYIEVRYTWGNKDIDRIKRFLKYYPDYKDSVQIIDHAYFNANEKKLKKGGFWI